MDVRAYEYVHMICKYEKGVNRFVCISMCSSAI